MWFEPKDVARGVYNSASPLERTRIKNNLSNYGNAIFQQFNYTKEQAEEFLVELNRLLSQEEE